MTALFTPCDNMFSTCFSGCDEPVCDGLASWSTYCIDNPYVPVVLFENNSLIPGLHACHACHACQGTCCMCIFVLFQIAKLFCFILTTSLQWGRQCGSLPWVQLRPSVSMLTTPSFCGVWRADRAYAGSCMLAHAFCLQAHKYHCVWRGPSLSTSEAGTWIEWASSCIADSG